MKNRDNTSTSSGGCLTHPYTLILLVVFLIVFIYLFKYIKVVFYQEVEGLHFLCDFCSFVFSSLLSLFL